MKYFMLFIMMLAFVNVKGQGENSNCEVENPIRFIQEIIPSINPRIKELKTKSQYGIYPTKCSAYRLNYKKNGKLKDSTLMKKLKWNTDGSLASVIEYDHKEEVWNTKSYLYETVGDDSVITAFLGIFGKHRYFIDKNGHVVKFISANDTNFTSIRYQTEYEYDNDGNMIKSKLSYPGKTENDQFREWRWGADSLYFSAKVDFNGKVSSRIVLNSDSCYVQLTNYGQTHPFESIYYFDSKENVIRIIDRNHFKKGIKTEVTNYERNNNGDIVRLYGIYWGKKFDTRIIRDFTGLVIKEEKPLKRQVINYYYTF